MLTCNYISDCLNEIWILRISKFEVGRIVSTPLVEEVWIENPAFQSHRASYPFG
jgi:hypothetical protein